MKFKNLLYFIMTASAVLYMPYVHADDLGKDIFVTNAWVLLTPPVQTTTAAYMTIANNAPKEVVLVSVSSDIAQAAEIHQMTESNGMMNMAMATDLHIPAMGKVTLQPGGFHIMLINLKKPVKKGDIVPMILHFQDGSTMIVNAQVKMQEENGSSGMAGMKM